MQFDVQIRLFVEKRRFAVVVRRSGADLVAPACELGGSFAPNEGHEAAVYRTPDPVPPEATAVHLLQAGSPNEVFAFVWRYMRCWVSEYYLRQGLRSVLAEIMGLPAQALCVPADDAVDVALAALPANALIVGCGQ